MLLLSTFTKYLAVSAQSPTNTSQGHQTPTHPPVTKHGGIHGVDLTGNSPMWTVVVLLTAVSVAVLFHLFTFSWRPWTSCFFFQAPDPSVTSQSCFCVSHCPTPLTFIRWSYTMLSWIKMSAVDRFFTVDFVSTLLLKVNPVSLLWAHRDLHLVQGQEPSSTTHPTVGPNSSGSVDIHLPFRQKMMQCAWTSSQFIKQQGSTHRATYWLLELPNAGLWALSSLPHCG